MPQIPQKSALGFATSIFRARDTRAFFGLVEHDLALCGDAWRVARKKIVLQNEYVPTMIDIYCV